MGEFMVDMMEPNFLVIILLLVFGIWLLILTLLYVFARPQKTNKGQSKEATLDEQLDVLSLRIKDLQQKHAVLEKSTLQHIQKVSVLRYNPFGDTGGDQSFAIALLDAKNSGVIISSLHGRDRTRIYAKPITAGDATPYELSSEEKNVLEEAMKKT